MPVFEPSDDQEYPNDPTRQITINVCLMRRDDVDEDFDDGFYEDASIDVDFVDALDDATLKLLNRRLAGVIADFVREQHQVKVAQICT